MQVLARVPNLVLTHGACRYRFDTLRAAHTLSPNCQRVCDDDDDLCLCAGQPYGYTVQLYASTLRSPMSDVTAGREHVMCGVHCPNVQSRGAAVSCTGAEECITLIFYTVYCQLCVQLYRTGPYLHAPMVIGVH